MAYRPTLLVWLSIHITLFNDLLDTTQAVEPMVWIEYKAWVNTLIPPQIHDMFYSPLLLLQLNHRWAEVWTFIFFTERDFQKQHRIGHE